MSSTLGGVDDEVDSVRDWRASHARGAERLNRSREPGQWRSAGVEGEERPDNEKNGRRERKGMNWLKRREKVAELDCRVRGEESQERRAW